MKQSGILKLLCRRILNGNDVGKGEFIETTYANEA